MVDGLSILQVSISWCVCNAFFICFKWDMGKEDVLVEESSVGSRATFRSPPMMVSPVEKFSNLLRVEVMNCFWPELGAYILAKVMGVFPIVPLRKRNLPFSSASVAEMDHGMDFSNRIETPFERELSDREWYMYGNFLGLNLGSLDLLKWVSWKNKMWGLCLLRSLSSAALFSGEFMPFALSDMSLSGTIVTRGRGGG